LFHLSALIRWLVFWLPATAVGVGVAGLWVDGSVALVGGVVWLFCQFMLAVWFPTFSFERWGYQVREADLVVAHGVFFREVIALPTGRIQHVDMKQGPLEQWLGLARLQVYTASGMGADAVIPGLDLEVAERLRDALATVSGDDGV